MPVSTDESFRRAQLESGPSWGPWLLGSYTALRRSGGLHVGDSIFSDGLEFAVWFDSDSSSRLLGLLVC